MNSHINSTEINKKSLPIPFGTVMAWKPLIGQHSSKKPVVLNNSLTSNQSECGSPPSQYPLSPDGQIILNNLNMNKELVDSLSFNENIGKIESNSHGMLLDKMLKMCGSNFINFDLKQSSKIVPSCSPRCSSEPHEISNKEDSGLDTCSNKSIKNLRVYMDPIIIKTNRLIENQPSDEYCEWYILSNLKQYGIIDNNSCETIAKIVSKDSRITEFIKQISCFDEPIYLTQCLYGDANGGMKLRINWHVNNSIQIADICLEIFYAFKSNQTSTLNSSSQQEISSMLIFSLDILRRSSLIIQMAELIYKWKDKFLIIDVLQRSRNIFRILSDIETKNLQHISMKKFVDLLLNNLLNNVVFSVITRKALRNIESYVIKEEDYKRILDRYPAVMTLIMKICFKLHSHSCSYYINLSKHLKTIIQ